MIRMLGKKGVSPLIATILLIAFAVALGSVIMNWGLNLSLSDSCGGVNLEFQKQQNSNVCYTGKGDSGYIMFSLENSGSVDVHGISMLLIGQEETKFIDIDGILIKRHSFFETTDGMITHGFVEPRLIQDIEFTPKVLTEGKRERCTKKTIHAESIAKC